MKPPRYARVSLTPRCPLRCRYCVGPGETAGVDGERILAYEELLVLIDILKEAGIKKFRFTGGEPFAREGVFEFFKKVKLNNWGVTTSLSIPGLAPKINSSPLENINVSLDTLDRKKYRWLTRGADLDTVIENIDGLKEKNVKLNTILIEGFNTSEAQDIIDFAHRRAFIPRFIEKMDFTSDNLKGASINTLRKHLLLRGIIEESSGREGNSASLYYKTSAGIPVGFIEPLSNPFCGTCDRVRITASGGLKTCLFSPPVANISSALSLAREEAERVVKEFVSLKSPGRDISPSGVRMSAVGG